MEKSGFFKSSVDFCGQNNLLRAAWLTNALLFQEKMSDEAWFKLRKYILSNQAPDNRAGIKDLNKLLLWYVLKNKRQNEL